MVMDIQKSDFLEQFSENLLSRRIINVLSGQDIFTIWDFINYFWSTYGQKIKSLRGIWNDSTEKLNRFIELLINKWFDFSKNTTISNDNGLYNGLGISEKLLKTWLIAFPSILSKRTLNALEKSWITTVAQLFEKYDFINTETVEWLWKIWYAEIEELTRDIKKRGNWEKKWSDDLIIKDLLDDNRLINILNYNLIFKIGDLKDYIIWAKDWSNLRYLKDEDIQVLSDIYFHHHSDSNVATASVAETFLGCFTPEDKQIIIDRIIEDKNLEEIGISLGITRERVRQKQKDIEKRIIELWKSLLEEDNSVYNKIHNIIRDYNFILLPKQTYLFDFLWFSPNESSILYLLLSWLKWLHGEFLEKWKLFIIYPSEYLLSGDQARDLYYFTMHRLLRNNSDLNIEELVYEYLLEEKQSEKFYIRNLAHNTSQDVKKRRKKRLKSVTHVNNIWNENKPDKSTPIYENKKWWPIELIL